MAAGVEEAAAVVAMAAVNSAVGWVAVREEVTDGAAAAAMVMAAVTALVAVAVCAVAAWAAVAACCASR